MFEDVMSNKDIIEDLYGVNPYSLKEVLQSILDEIDIPTIDIMYIAGKGISEYILFSHNETGLSSVHYDDFLKSDRPVNFAYIRLIGHKDIGKDIKDIDHIVNFINSEIGYYDIGDGESNIKAVSKFSGIPEGGGFSIQLSF